MFMFLAGVGMTLGAQYVLKRFGAGIRMAISRAEKEIDKTLKGE